MCLYSHTDKPLVSDKDLTAYKVLKRNNARLVTPYYDFPVSLNSTLRADGTYFTLSKNHYNEIGGGFIHAYIDKGVIRSIKGCGGLMVAKAVIKAGTPFHVSYDLEEIAAKEMFVTDTTEENGRYFDLSDLDETRGEIKKLLFEQDGMVSPDGVKVGDVLLSDKKTFVHLDDIAHDMDVIGIVSFIRPDGKPHVTALCEDEKLWCDYKFYNKDLRWEDIDNIENSINELCGYALTRQFVEEHGSHLWHYPIIEYCVNFSTKGTEKGDWYLPSCGEMLRTSKNTFFINKTVDKLCRTVLSVLSVRKQASRMYWTSTMDLMPLNWGRGVKGVKCAYDVAWNVHCVRPSLNLG